MILKRYLPFLLLSILFLSVTQAGSAQCAVNTVPAGYDCTFGDEISSVTFATVTTANAGCNDPIDAHTYFSTPVRTVTKGQTYAFTVNYGFWPQFGGIWIDFDNNGQFDNTEAVFLSTTADPSHSGNITIPLGAATGVVRMRVRCDGWFLFNAPDACIGFSDGETEDYDLNIIAPPPLDISATTLSSPSEFTCGGVSPVTVVITNTGANTIDFSVNNVTVTSSVTGPNPATFPPVVISTGTLAPAGTLNVQVSAAYTMTLGGTYTFSASATTPGDGNTGNDAMAPFVINVSQQNTLPVTVDFSALPNPPFLLQQVAGVGNWQLISGSMTNPTLAPAIGTGILYFDSWNFNAGTISRLLTPCYNFTGACAPLLEFWMSQDNGFTGSPDSVAVKVSTDGGQTFSPTLLNAVRVNTTFTVPGWRLFSLPLTAYAGQNGVRVAFDAHSEFGRSIGIDAITVRNDTMARISGNATVCPGNGTNLSIQFAGAAPFSVTYTNGTTPVTVTGVTNNPYVFSVTPAATSTYTVTAVSNACGTGTFTGSAVVTVSTPPTTTLSASQTVCQGSPATLTVNLTGSQPWNITWTDGTANNNINGINSSPFTFTVTPSAQTTYSITAVNDANCPGTVFTGLPVVSLTPIPTATLSGNSTICPGNSSTVAVVFTGASPWQIIYTDGVTPVTRTGITNNPFVFQVTPSVSTTYTLTDVSNLCGSGTATGTAAVTIANVATATLSADQTICNGTSAQLTVALTGASPWSITWTNGTTPTTVAGITNNNYTFNVTPSATTTYSLTQVSDPCGAGTVGGTARIQILPNPAAVISGPSSVCAGNPVQLTVSMTGPAPWDLSYTDGTNTQTVNAIANSPYIITDNPVAGNTYALTALNDAFGCNATNLGLPLSIQVDDVAQVSISADQTLCGSGSAVLTVNLLSGSTPYNFDWTDGTNTTTENNITTSTYTITVNPTVNTTYSINSTNNLCGNNVITSSAIVSLFPSITATLTAPASVCAGNATDLTFNLTGTSPFDLVYTDGVNQYTETGIVVDPYLVSVTPVVNNQYDIVTVTDANGCVVTGTGPSTIQVDSLPSADLNGNITVCAGAGSGLMVTFTGTGPYDLTYDDGTNMINVPGITNNPYMIPSGTVAGTTVYTLFSVSNAQCGAGIVSGSGSITVIDEPTAQLTGGGALCGVNNTTLTLQFTGQAPWFISYTDGGSNFSAGNITTNPYIFSVTPTVNPANYSILSLSDAACTNGVSTGTAVVNLGQAPNATMNGSNSVCTGGNYNLIFNLTGTPPFSVTFLDGTVPVTVPGIMTSPYTHTMNPMAGTTYTLTGASDQFCSNNNLNYIIPVATTPLPTASFTPVLVYGGQITTFNNSLYGTTYLWDFGDMTGASTGFQPTHTYAANGVYTILLTVTNGCGSASTSQIITISSVSTDAEMDADGFEIYPNPSQGVFMLRSNLNGDIRLRITDLQGAEVWSSARTHAEGDADLRIDVQDKLSKGLYMLHIETGDRHAVRKIQVE